MMRFIIIFILLICIFAFTSAQTYTFNMYETSGGDYSVSIDLQRKQITASRAGRQIFKYNYRKFNIDNGTGIIGFSFDDRYSVIMRPDHDEHYFLVRKDAIFCSTSNASQEFYFKPNSSKEYLKDVEQMQRIMEISLSDDDEQPTFPGGMDALMLYISKYVKYPKEWQESNIHLTLIVRIVVGKDGKVESYEIVRPQNVTIKEEVKDVNGNGLIVNGEKVYTSNTYKTSKFIGDTLEEMFRNMPRWKPCIVNGEPQNSYYTIPIRFVLH